MEDKKDGNLEQVKPTTAASGVGMTIGAILLPANWQSEMNYWEVDPRRFGPPPPIVIPGIDNSQNNPSTVNSESRNWRDDKKLSPGEIKQLEQNVGHIARKVTMEGKEIYIKIKIAMCMKAKRRQRTGRTNWD
ncbi:hypothetical protein ACMGDE_19870 [Parapedobacter sp. DT-150]